MFSHRPVPAPCPPSGRARPVIVSSDADWRFETHCRRSGLDPSDPFLGGYVDIQWDQWSRILAAYRIDPAGTELLEFGFNVGASAICLAHLGARVTAVDISRPHLEIARLNAERFGADAMDFRLLEPADRLPFSARSFDLVVCNSVLEYVDHAALPTVLHELDRVLRPGGMVLVTGTSSRLWPREVHSHRWLANYVPRWIDRATGVGLQRGVWPWTIRSAFGSRYENLDAADRGRAFWVSRRAMGVNPVALRAIVTLAKLLRVGPGMLVPNISCLLRKMTDHA